MIRTVLKNSNYQEEIKKSKFIGYSFYVKNEEEAIDYIDKITDIHSDATHNTYAYIIGESKNLMRFSDDGEPKGTAGMPMLEVLKLKDLTDTLVIVTRYFGGTLLGAKGLVRAYSNTASKAIENNIIVIRKFFKRILIRYDYVHHGKAVNYLSKFGYKILNEKFTDIVELEIYSDPTMKVVEDLMEITSGTVNYYILGEELLPTDGREIIYEV